VPEHHSINDLQLLRALDLMARHGVVFALIAGDFASPVITDSNGQELIPFTASADSH